MPNDHVNGYDLLNEETITPAPEPDNTEEQGDGEG